MDAQAPEEGRFVSGKPIAIVIGAVLIIAALIKWWPSDIRTIRQELDALADVVSVPPEETEVSRNARLADFESYFADSVQIRLTGQHIPNREALMGIVERWTPPAGGVYVAFENENVSVPGDNTAHVTASAKISRKDPATGEIDIETRPVAFDMAKRRGNWLITNVESEIPPAR